METTLPVRKPARARTKALPSEIRRLINRKAHALALEFERQEKTRITEMITSAMTEGVDCEALRARLAAT